MTILNRRAALLGLSATTLTACANGIGGDGAARIDARADATVQYMFSRYPGTRNLADSAAGMLVMPVVTKAGLGLGGAYGRGVLRIGQSTVDYYSAAAATAGLQIGAQQYAHVLFFMTEDALGEFRRSSGWAVGANMEYALNDEGQALRAESTTSMAPVIAVVFGQTGLIVGATLEGLKYTRIIP